MKRLLILLAAVIGFAACESDEQSSAPFDDVIADFDVQEMDQAQFESILVIEGMQINQLVIKYKDAKWGDALYHPDGYNAFGKAFLFYENGTSKFIDDYNPTGRKEGVLCVTGRWSYDHQTQMLVAHKGTRARMIAKVLYYRHPRVILEGILEDLEDYKIRWDCTVGVENPEALLESCTIFRTAETE